MLSHLSKSTCTIELYYVNGGGAGGGIGGGKVQSGRRAGGLFGPLATTRGAGGDVEAEDNLATRRQIPLTRIAVGEKLNMEDIGTSWYQQTQD